MNPSRDARMQVHVHIEESVEMRNELRPWAEVEVKH